MKAASKSLYLIGLIFNFVAITFLITFVVLSGVVAGSADIISRIATETQQTFELIRNAFIFVLVVCAVGLFINVLVSVAAIIARKNLAQSNGRTFAHVVLLIAGILSFNLFYLIGSIFGLTAANQDEELDD